MRYCDRKCLLGSTSGEKLIHITYWCILLSINSQDTLFILSNSGIVTRKFSILLPMILKKKNRHTHKKENWDWRFFFKYFIISSQPLQLGNYLNNSQIYVIMCHYVTLRVIIFLPFSRTMPSNTCPAAYASDKKKELLKRKKSLKHISFIIIMRF